MCCSNFNTLSSADDDSDEEEIDSNRGRRKPKKNVEKLNVKGETALHRACIKQDIALVRLLIQQVRYNFSVKTLLLYKICYLFTET